MNDLHEEAVRLQTIADQAIEGGDALGAYVYLHQLEKIVGEAKKQIQDAAIVCKHCGRDLGTGTTRALSLIHI